MAVRKSIEDIYKMDDNTLEKAKYIVTYYGGLLNPDEAKAFRHLHSTFKLEDNTDERLPRMYYKMGWLSDDPVIVQLLAEGDEKFMISCAKRILKESPEKVFINYCPNCGRLARTPYAKQCRYCHHDWH